MQSDFKTFSLIIQGLLMVNMYIWMMVLIVQSTPQT